MNRGRSSQVTNSCSLAAELLAVAAVAKSCKDFRNRALDALATEFEGARVAWVHQFEQRWEAAGSAGSLSNLPIELAASAADEASMLLANQWLALPISSSGEPAEVILLNPGNVLAGDEARALSQILHDALKIADDRARMNARLSQLQMLMEQAVSWQRSPSLSDLLQAMAEAAARILRGDRASIFLWDRAKNQLVGHPALGVEGDRCAFAMIKVSPAKC